MVGFITPSRGLSAIPVSSICEEGFFQVIHSGQVISEKGELIDGAIRIDRNEIKSFDRVGSVGNALGSQVFELKSGRFFRLIDRFNSDNYVIGYEVIPCPKKCKTCPTNCRTEKKRVIYYARQQRISDTDIPVKVARKRINCFANTVPKVDCK